MNVYKISCYSECGTYFSSYLQSVTIFAANEKDAVEKVILWLDEVGRQFISKDVKKWNIELIYKETDTHFVIDYREDSDY